MNFYEEQLRHIGETYEYDEGTYDGIINKMRMICKVHGEFWQTPINHICKRNGCPKCKQSIMEREVENMLKDENIDFISQYKPTFLKNGKGFKSCDFFIPNKNIIIECQGRQHFEPIDYFCGKDGLDKIQNRDSEKKRLLEENGYKIVYYSNDTNLYEYLGVKIIKKLEDLLEFILQK